MRIVRARADAVVVALALATGACVEPFDGSNVQIDFNQFVQTNPRPGATLEPDQPPPDTHYELYATQIVRDETVDPPVVQQVFVFKVLEFEIRGAIDMTSPCFIDIEATRFPGIHVTQYAQAARDETGIGGVPGDQAPFAPGLDPGAVSDVLTADRRNSLLPMIQASLKAVTSHADFRYPVAGTACAGESGFQPLDIPPARCMDAESNAVRLEVCRNLWKSAPDYYEGSDKVFTLPLNGHFFGMVEGTNPINGGFVGGSGFFVPTNLVGVDAYSLNWQFDDIDHDGNPDVAAGFEPSPTGYQYMIGTPRQVTRGTFTVPLHHPTSTLISATMTIFPDLGSDDVHF